MSQEKSSLTAKSSGGHQRAQANPLKRLKSTLYISPPLLRLIQNLQYHHVQETGGMLTQQSLIVRALIAYAESMGVDIPKGVQ